MGKYKTNYFGPFELSACITFIIIFTMFASKLHDIYKENEIEEEINLAKAEYMCSGKGGALAYSGHFVCRNGERILWEDLKNVIIKDDSYYIKKADKND